MLRNSHDRSGGIVAFKRSRALNQARRREVSAGKQMPRRVCVIWLTVSRPPRDNMAGALSLDIAQDTATPANRRSHMSTDCVAKETDERDERVEALSVEALDRVAGGLNPQPLPPGIRFLNPQPLPPGIYIAKH
jgi:hypothetical protein